jgi:hypothetical protein
MQRSVAPAGRVRVEVLMVGGASRNRPNAMQRFVFAAQLEFKILNKMGLGTPFVKGDVRLGTLVDFQGNTSL